MTAEQSDKDERAITSICSRLLNNEPLFIDEKRALVDLALSTFRPESGTINAAGRASGEQSPHFARGQENKPAPAAPTPRTDAAEHERDRQPCGWVWADFARDLERELADCYTRQRRAEADIAELQRAVSTIGTVSVPDPIAKVSGETAIAAPTQHQRVFWRR